MSVDNKANGSNTSHLRNGFSGSRKDASLGTSSQQQQPQESQQQQQTTAHQQQQQQQQQQTTSLDEAKRYVRRNFIAKGSHKVVYHCFDEEEGIEVAWNEIDTSSISDLGKVQREIELLQSLNHPSIIRCHGSWLDEERRALVFITELMTSGTLTDFISQQSSQSLKPHVMAKYSRQILSGLSYLASQDVIHRDLKSNNIFINGHKGEVKIGDLGLSIASRAANSVLGTPEYMAPEIYEENYTNAVDIWSFGMCMLQMVSGVHPYKECENVAQIFKKVTNGVLPEASESVTDPMVKEVIFSCLDIDPEKRPTAEELLSHPLFKKDEVPNEGNEGGGVGVGGSTPGDPQGATQIESGEQQPKQGSQESSTTGGGDLARLVEAATPMKEQCSNSGSEATDSKQQSKVNALDDLMGPASDVSPARVVEWIRSGPRPLQSAFAQFALEKGWIEARHHAEWREWYLHSNLDNILCPDVNEGGALSTSVSSPEAKSSTLNPISPAAQEQNTPPSVSRNSPSHSEKGSVDRLESSVGTPKHNTDINSSSSKTYHTTTLGNNIHDKTPSGTGAAVPVQIINLPSHAQQTAPPASNGASPWESINSQPSVVQQQAPVIQQQTSTRPLQNGHSVSQDSGVNNGSVEDLFSLASNSSVGGAKNTSSIPRPASSNGLSTPLVEQDKADKKKAAELTEQKLLAQMMGGSAGSATNGGSSSNLAGKQNSSSSGSVNGDAPPPYTPLAEDGSVGTTS